MCAAQQKPKQQGAGGRAAWGALILLTLLGISLLEYAELPAAPLLGGIAAGVWLALRDAGLKIPAVLFNYALSLAGCLIAKSFTPETLRSILDNWFLTLAPALGSILFCFLLGWFLTIKQILPGTTAIWGASPGAATPMTLLSEAFGADMRLVAVMQYLRVILVAAAAALAARLLGEAPAGPELALGLRLFPPVAWPDLAETLLLAAACAALGQAIRLPAAPMLLGLLAGAALRNMGALNLELPGWSLLPAYAVIGWQIGLRFTRQAILYALRALPVILAATLLMLLSGAGIALLLHLGAGTDPLTAYLAASPGGADSVALIAASSGADAGFVMSIQSCRLILVLLTGPPLAKLAASRAMRRAVTKM